MPVEKAPALQPAFERLCRRLQDSRPSDPGARPIFAVAALAFLHPDGSLEWAISQINTESVHDQLAELTLDAAKAIADSAEDWKLDA
jgi:hypothetical protein